ncbi:hypothetical protein [Ruegeria sp. HKCCC2117]|uniref:hypothetical protein n=1 Tax=Ruegeria sp. HKCCC2117 TaxID=2682992 RepID=UPI001489AE71|nr:hypothetical protein [Ruegeria sp. HKCCC2117]
MIEGTIYYGRATSVEKDYIEFDFDCEGNIQIVNYTEIDLMSLQGKCSYADPAFAEMGGGLFDPHDFCPALMDQFGPTASLPDKAVVIDLPPIGSHQRSSAYFFYEAIRLEGNDWYGLRHDQWFVHNGLGIGTADAVVIFLRNGELENERNLCFQLYNEW